MSFIPPPSRVRPRARWRHVVFGRAPRRTMIRIVVLSLLVTLVCTQWLRPCRVSGISMEPTIRDGTFNVINLRRYRTADPQRNHVVAARMNALDRRNFLLKRVVALPGETVAFRDGQRYLDGALALEPYLSDPGNWNVGPLRLSADEFFIVGDNRSAPWEQHVGGAIRREHIVGSMVFP